MTETAAPLEVSPGVWLVRLALPFPVGSVNVYLLRARDGFLLLDCGMKTQACREGLASALAAIGIGWTDIRRLVISHLHPDHFGLATEIKKLSGAEVLMHSIEAALVSSRFMDAEFFLKHSAWLAENGVPPSLRDEIAQAARGVAEFVDVVRVDRTLADGDRLEAEGGHWEVLWTPGHSPGLITLYCAARRLYFSSDHIIEKITPNISLHAWSAENPLEDYLRSLARLRTLDIDCILPSHGQPFRGHREWIAATEQHHRERCRKMLDAVNGAARTAHQVVGQVWGEHLSPLNQRFAVAETLAHLEYLRRQQAVRSRRDGGMLYWEAV